MNLEMAGVMHPKTSGASIIWNWLSRNLGDWMTIIVSAYQRRIIRQLIAGEKQATALIDPGSVGVAILFSDVERHERTFGERLIPS
jgi:hypothetical protein